MSRKIPLRTNLLFSIFVGLLFLGLWLFWLTAQSDYGESSSNSFLREYISGLNQENFPFGSILTACMAWIPALYYGLRWSMKWALIYNEHMLKISYIFRFKAIPWDEIQTVSLEKISVGRWPFRFKQNHLVLNHNDKNIWTTPVTLNGPEVMKFLELAKTKSKFRDDRET